MSWHASDDMLRRYARGETGMALTASVESHLLRCGVCRGRLAPAVDAPLEAAWTGVLDAIQAPPAPHLVRVLRRLGLRDADGVLLAAARAVSGAWTLATLAVVVFAALATFADAGRGLALYLLVAPLVPVVGVVAAFGATDPLVELASTTPYSKARLAALRTAAVLVTGVPLSILVASPCRTSAGSRSRGCRPRSCSPSPRSSR
jgi:hypothetical protein